MSSIKQYSYQHSLINTDTIMLNIHHSIKKSNIFFVYGLNLYSKIENVLSNFYRKWLMIKGFIKIACFGPTAEKYTLMHRQFQTSAKTIFTEESTTQHSFRSTGSIPLSPDKPKTSSFSKKQLLSGLVTLLQKKTLNKKRYIFQLLKRFLFFPDSSVSSSCLSVSKYDPLLFTDEHLHTILKIMQTQLISCKIWAFINLKVNRKQENMKMGIKTFERVSSQMAFCRKEEIFYFLRQKALGGSKNAKLIQTPAYSLLISNNISHKIQNDNEKSIKVQATKLEISKVSKYSKRTYVETQRDMMSSRQRNNEFQCSYCQFCCGQCCCQVDPLWQRIQYLKHLQQMVEQKQRSAFNPRN